ncbi:MAG: hypothetical protein KDK78_06315, partial [Chlamydiia bacterium]|nr:hypothetical protein [Chlamydiia bacterium]
MASYIHLYEETITLCQSMAQEHLDASLGPQSPLYHWLTVPADPTLDIELSKLVNRSPDEVLLAIDPRNHYTLLHSACANGWFKTGLAIQQKACVRGLDYANFNHDTALDLLFWRIGENAADLDTLALVSTLIRRMSPHVLCNNKYMRCIFARKHRDLAISFLERLSKHPLRKEYFLQVIEEEVHRSDADILAFTASLLHAFDLADILNSNPTLKDILKQGIDNDALPWNPIARCCLAFALERFDVIQRVRNEMNEDDLRQTAWLFLGMAGL